MEISIERRTNFPPRSEVFDSTHRRLAILTDGAYTVRLSGPDRTFPGEDPAREVSQSVWVRTLPKPFAGHVDSVWLAAALSANEQGIPDVLWQ
jgi:hypothetical protein